MSIKRLISEEVIEVMRNEIEKADGNEVLFRGIPDETGKVTEVVVLARGNKYAAPAVLNRMKKDEVMIHNHPSGHLHPSDADINVATMFESSKNGAFYIVNNNVDDVYEVVTFKKTVVKPIDIEPYFSRKGMLSQIFKGFEYRDEQLNMAKHIETGLNKGDTPVVVEAGTGTGKTLAYLIPAIEWALANGERVVITTNTINLQEQLLTKDIPIAKTVISKKFNYILVKGRGNYVCNRKMHNVQMGNLAATEEYNEDQRNEVKRIIEWGETTDSGDKAELTFEPDRSVWELFQSEGDMCAGPKCPYRKECFFLKAREAKKKADVLITNHHLYFSDLAIRKQIGFKNEYSILPDYGLVVFDEAHNVEKVARDYFSYEVSRYSFTKVMNQIYFPFKKQKRNTAIAMLEEELEKGKLDSEEVRDELEELKKQHKNLYEIGRNYFDFVINMFSQTEEGTTTHRVKKEDIKDSPFYAKLLLAKDSLSEEASNYINKTNDFIEKLHEKDEDNFVIDDYSRFIARLETFFKTFDFIHEFKDENFIYWIEVKKGKWGNSKLVATPLKVDVELQENLYMHLKTLVFTSATIAIGEDFNYFKESIGLEGFETLDKVIHSPFDYDNQMAAYIPTDIVDPVDRSFNDETAEIIKSLVLASKGNTFVLFTSYSTLNYVYYTIRNELLKEGMDIFVQGMAPRSHMVNMYKKAKKPVLFGTDSFWEGVDIKGEKLSNVIIAKIPFKVPSDPVTEAIIENITAEGGNPFFDFQVPEAVIKFKQGIGRLIRSKSDSGNVVVLDNRVIKKFYGKYFRESIPTKNIKQISKSEIIREIIKD